MSGDFCFAGPAGHAKPVVRAAHVGFTVSDLDRAIAIFCDLFGYAVVSRSGRDPKGVARLTGVEGAKIEVAHLQGAHPIGIELIAYSQPPAQARAALRPQDPGYTHLSFEVSDLRGLVERAAAYGVRAVGDIVRTSRNPDFAALVVYLTDVDGINIELIQPPAG